MGSCSCSEVKLGDCLICTRITINVSDFNGKTQPVRLRPGSTTADLTRKCKGENSEGIWLINSQASGLNEETELQDGWTAVFIPTLTLTLVALDGTRERFVVLASQPVSDVQRITGLVGPRETLFYRNQQLKEDCTFGEQEVTADSEINVACIDVEWQVGGMLQTLGLAYDQFDSVGNRDYTTAPNSTRGGQVYYPPNGWKR